MRCDDCGQFMREASSWAHIYDFVAMELSHEHFRCKRCTERLGPVRTNARPANGDLSPYEGTRP